MKWDYEQFLSQPSWFVAMLLELLQAEEAEAARQNQ
jgi:hypothetical protein